MSHRTPALPPDAPNDSPALLAGSFARAVQGGVGPASRMQRGVELVVEMLEGCDHAGVMIAERRSLSTMAATDDVVHRGDTLQYELDEGPGLDSVRDQHTVISQVLREDRRWPRWAPRVVADLGVYATMSLPLYTDEDVLGALNLYADRTRPWDVHGIALGLSLADQLATSLADAREIEHRDSAIAARTVIGQAQGIVMERFGFDTDRAFSYLRRVSQESNRKLALVAADIVGTRRLPGSGSDAADQQDLVDQPRPRPRDSPFTGAG